MERLPEGDRKTALDVMPQVKDVPQRIRIRPAIWEQTYPKKSVVSQRLNPLTRKGMLLVKTNAVRAANQYSENSETTSRGMRF